MSSMTATYTAYAPGDGGGVMTAAAETTWHRIGAVDEVRAQAPMRAYLANHRVAVFVHEGVVTAIADRCNHKGGPLSEGVVRGEYVTCPWHAWEYSVVTGRGPAGFDEEQVAVYAVEERADGVYVATPPREREVLQLVAEGRSSRQIADLLGIRPATVETHRTHILEKLDLHSTVELVRYAAQRGVIK
jgi:nitrite reductase/ring-hydroxylating ferredoxin subunit